MTGESDDLSSAITQEAERVERQMMENLIRDAVVMRLQQFPSRQVQIWWDEMMFGYVVVMSVVIPTQAQPMTTRILIKVEDIDEYAMSPKKWNQYIDGQVQEFVRNLGMLSGGRAGSVLTKKDRGNGWTETLPNAYGRLNVSLQSAGQSYRDLARSTQRITDALYPVHDSEVDEAIESIKQAWEHQGE